MLGQVILAANDPSDVDSYECGPDEVKIVRLLCNAATF